MTLTLLLAVSLVAGCRHADVPGPTHMTEFAALLAMPVSPADVRESYGSSPLAYGELRMPAGPGPFPLVVLVHGGCWRSAFDLPHDVPAATALTRAGLATWLIEYRRVGDTGGGWPGTFDDVEQAVAHVARLAERYPIDRSRIVLAGHSAGGQLALHVANRRAHAPGVAAAESLTIRTVVSLAGITDLRGYSSPSGCGSAVVPLVGGAATDVPQRYAATSPIEQGRIGIPLRLVHGGSDAIVPVAAARAFAEAARARGDEVTLSVVPDAGHFDLVDPTSAAWRVVLQAIRGAVFP
jgi:acetyl esterase/lipase